MEDQEHFDAVMKVFDNPPDMEGIHIIDSFLRLPQTAEEVEDFKRRLARLAQTGIMGKFGEYVLYVIAIQDDIKKAFANATDILTEDHETLTGIPPK